MPRRWLVGAFAVSAVFAALVAIFSSDYVHQLWGGIAACGYGLAAVALAGRVRRGPDIAVGLSFCGGLLVPLVWMAGRALEQPEVAVVARSGASLIHHGTPYTDAAVLAGTQDPNAYNPYLPVMALFGVPRALFGVHMLTDPRIWFGVGFVVLFAAALAVAGARDVLRWTALVTATPVIAFSLAVGGTDVPVLALLCLGLALLWRHPRPVVAGLVLGVAAATKATAWPALIVAATMLTVRDGWRTAGRFLIAAVVTACVIIGPVAVLWEHTLVENTILFPLGLASVKSQAVSPLPGHVLADTGHLGHLIAVSLLGLAGLGVLVSLVVRPPRNVPSATWRLIIGLALMFTLAPATRFGYFMYPLGLWAWLAVSQLTARRSQLAGDRASPGGDGPGPPGDRRQPTTA
jgi:Glycosyltransferase family 87